MQWLTQHRSRSNAGLTLLVPTDHKDLGNSLTTICAKTSDKSKGAKLQEEGTDFEDIIALDCSVGTVWIFRLPQLHTLHSNLTRWLKQSPTLIHTECIDTRKSTSGGIQFLEGLVKDVLLTPARTGGSDKPNCLILSSNIIL
ncbi:hypothetical protein Tco_1182123 [Tanacetum coccineum]